MALIGYARVSTQDQNLDLQQDALKKAGCDRIFTDTISGSKSERIGLREAVDFVREGDTLVVWRLDRLGRSLKHLIESVNSLQNKGIGFRSLQENVDTTTSGGKLVFHIFGSLAEFERDVIRERTQAGLKAARSRGRQGGRPPVLDSKKLELVRTMYAVEQDLRTHIRNKKPNHLYGLACNTFFSQPEEGILSWFNHFSIKSLCAASIRSETSCLKNVGTSLHVCWVYPYLDELLEPNTS